MFRYRIKLEIKAPFDKPSVSSIKMVKCPHVHLILGMVNRSKGVAQAVYMTDVREVVDYLDVPTTKNYSTEQSEYYFLHNKNNISKLISIFARFKEKFLDDKL